MFPFPRSRSEDPLSEPMSLLIAVTKPLNPTVCVGTPTASGLWDPHGVDTGGFTRPNLLHPSFLPNSTRLKNGGLPSWLLVFNTWTRSIMINQQAPPTKASFELPSSLVTAVRNKSPYRRRPERVSEDLDAHVIGRYASEA